MPVKWAPIIVVSIFKGKGDIRNCSCYRVMKLLKRRMKLMDKRLHRIVSVDEM